MAWFKSSLVTRQDNVIKIHSLQNSDSVNDFIQQIHSGYKQAMYEDLY